jgi:membrane associated rhomboid family serine protease
MFAFWMFGVALENIWGTKKFAFYCLVCCLGAAVMQQLTYWFMYDDLVKEVARISTTNVHFVNTGSEILSRSVYLDRVTDLINSINTIGASGIVFGVLLAFGLMFPNNYIYVYFLLPIKAKWFVIGYCVVELFEGVFRSTDGVAHFAHLGGALAGFILLMLWKRKNKQRFTHYREL